MQFSSTQVWKNKKTFVALNTVIKIEVSVKKKWNQKGFAAGANREVIISGAERMGIDIGDVIRETIIGMQNVAEEIGLKGAI